jgi:4-amino-4-deoxy-L-arabinose transferase-like glycosyltransferase
VSQVLAGDASIAMQKISLIGLAFVALVFGFFNLWQDWYLDPYFAAGVQSMLGGWHTFFFASFDPAGFISIDKPPLALWLQAASARVLGFSTFSLLLPQALSGLLSVFLLYLLVGRAFGHATGLLAGLMLSLTPICVATNRNNNMDSLVVACVLASTWAMLIAVETGRLKPLLLCALLLGLGFNIKFLQAFLVLPAFVVLYVLMPAISWRRRLIYGGLAAALLLVVSLAWLLAVDRVPASLRPFVGSSSNNTEWDLAFGYNGLGRVASGSTIATAYAGFGSSAGDPGPFRLLNRELGGQVSWLLPLAVAGLVVASRPVPPPQQAGGRRRQRTRADRARAPVITGRQLHALIAWGTWLASLSILYSGASYFHPYNLVMLAPPICALAAIGVSSLWQRYVRETTTAWLLPATLALCGLAQIGLLWGSSPWAVWLMPMVAVSVGASAVWLAAAPQAGRHRRRERAIRAVALACAGLLIAPAVWAAVPLVHYGDAEFPIAGPDLFNSALDSPRDTRDALAPASLIHFLLVHHHGERFIMAARFGGIAAPVMLATQQAVLTYGGYLGLDAPIGIDGLAGLVHRHAVRFFWILPAPSTGYKVDVEGWVRARCALIPPRVWAPANVLAASGPQLYDCARDQTPVSKR